MGNWSISAMAWRASASRASWVIMTMGTVPATSRPFWITAAMLMLCFPRMPETWDRTPGWSRAENLEIVVGHQVVDGFDEPPGGRGPIPSPGPAPGRGRPWMRLRARSMRSLTTALAVGIIPAPCAIEEDGSHRVPGEIHRVHGAVDVGQHVVPGDQGGMDPGLHPVPVVPGNGQKFQAVAEFPGELQVQGVKPADALPPRWTPGPVGPRRPGS